MEKYGRRGKVCGGRGVGRSEVGGRDEVGGRVRCGWGRRADWGSLDRYTLSMGKQGRAV